MIQGQTIEKKKKKKKKKHDQTSRRGQNHEKTIIWKCA